MNGPKVTIITPSYNSDKDIEACILSVAKQSYYNKEHLIIDNLSEDGTLDIVRKYAALYPHLHLITEKDNGIYDAMNKGIERSTGDWLYFLGSDDTFFDNEVLTDLFTSDAAVTNDILYGNVQWGPNGTLYDGEFSCLKLMEKNICHQALFFRREVFTRLGTFDVQYKALADWVFNMQWFGREDIRRAYLDRIIAVYNPCGFSSIHYDTMFFENQGKNIENHFPEVYNLLYTRERQIKELNTERQKAIASHDKAQKELQQESSMRQDKINELEYAINKMVNSSSWRMTKPIRKLTNSVRKRSRKIRKLLFRQLNPSDSNFITFGNDYQQWITQFDTLDEKKLRLINKEIKGMLHYPKISILMPVYNPRVQFIDQAIKSVRNQLYPHWELCIADDGSHPEILALIKKYAGKDKKIRYVFRAENGHISEASNSALDLVSNDYTALLDHDDLLTPDALYWVAREIVNHPEAALIYSDEDKLNEQGKRCDPYFKCDFNYNLLLSHNMISHLGVYKTSLLREIGGFRKGFEGSQDYDIALRTIEKLDKEQIRHIPKVLYHWRIHNESTALSGDIKPYAHLAALNAINEHLERMKVLASAEPSIEVPGFNRVRYQLPSKPPFVEIIVLTRDKLGLIKPCIESILEKTTYPDYSITIVDNGSAEKETLEQFAAWKKHPRISIVKDDIPFNFSKLNNRAVERSDKDFVCLMNNDIEVISPDWLDEMVTHALQQDIGAVGARLWYPNETLQHGGVILGVGGLAGHATKHLKKGDPGYFGRACLQQEFSAVTAACLLVKREHYRSVEGFDETHLTIAFNDVDFCLKLREKGLRNLWTPYAELYHHESASRGYEDTPEKQARFQKELEYMIKRWAKELHHDPAYSPNLTLEKDDFSLAWPPRQPN